MADALNLDAARLAIIGMRGALDRHAHAWRSIDFDAAGASAVECMTWGCALDDRLRKTTAGYVDQRKASRHGSYLPALRHARDRHMHQVVTSHQPIFMVTYTTEGDDPPTISPETHWVRADVLGDAPRRVRDSNPEYWPQRQAYVDLLEEKATSFALSGALHWLTQVVEGRGVDLPEWEWPGRRTPPQPQD